MSDGICGKSAAPYVLIPRPLFNHNKVLGASDSPRWGASQSGFGHGRAIDTSSRTDPQRGRCEYEVESLLWQSSLTLLVLDVYEEMKAGLFGWSGAFAHRPGFLV